MLYLNGKLVDIKGNNAFGKKMREFDKEFAKYLADDGRLVKPITIKYKDGLITPDPDNPGKFDMPSSKGLKFIANVFWDGQQSEIRYSSTPGRPNPKTGELEFQTQSMPIVKGRATIYDKELALFFWAISPQNYGRPEFMANNDAWFVIENVSYENKQIADEKRIKAMLNVKLWSPTEEGGLSDEQLIDAAKMILIPNVEQYVEEDDLDGLKILIEKLIHSNREKAEQFLHAASRTSVTGKNQKQRAYIVLQAIDLRIINQDAAKRSFFMCDENGKNSGAALYKWKVAEADTLGAFYTYMKTENPELLATIEERVEFYSELKSKEKEVEAE